MHERHKKECSLYQQKLFCHVAITKKNIIKSLYSNSLPKRHYLYVVTLGKNSTVHVYKKNNEVATLRAGFATAEKIENESL